MNHIEPNAAYQALSSAGAESGNGARPVVPSCPICCCEIMTEEDSITCPDCATKYHKDCWNENKGCAIYGCKSAHSLDVHAQQQPPLQQQMPWGGGIGQGQISCPFCYTMLSPGTAICPACGHSIGRGITPGANIPQPDIAEISEKVSTAAVVPLLYCHIMLLKDIGKACKKLFPRVFHVLKSYGKAFSRYADFKGSTSRSDFFCFALISTILYLLFFFLLDLDIKYILIALHFLATACPTFAIMVRRLRDIGLSAWFLFAVPFFPLLLFCPTFSLREGNAQNGSAANNQNANHAGT